MATLNPLHYLNSLVTLPSLRVLRAPSVRRTLIQCSRRAAVSYGLVAAMLLMGSSYGQQTRHYLATGQAVPGELAFKALLANPQWQLRVQPVKLMVPEGCAISAWDQVAFTDVHQLAPVVGLSIGPVYRFRVSGLPEHPEVQLYPSIELINQLNPPAGLELRFPIPVFLSLEDLQEAAQGRLVTKVVYLENPDTALPYRQMLNDQPYFDVGDTTDPLRAAERLGRPMAVVRVGSRTPSVEELNAPQAFSGIPLTVFPAEYAGEFSRQAAGVTQVSFAGTPSMAPRQPAGTQDSSGCPSCPPATQWQGFTCPPTLLGGDCEPTGSPWTPHRDEFLCDGADRDLKVVVREDGTLAGLDREDTIGHFETPDGQIQIAESNRVCIYSPRFAAVRRLARSSVTSEVSRVATRKDHTQWNAAHNAETTGSTLQQLQPQRYRTASTAGAFIDEMQGVMAENILTPSGFGTRYQPYENLSLIRLGRHRSSESARLNLGMESASVWADNLGLEVAEKHIQPVITRDPLRVQEITSISSDSKSLLRLTKVASKIAAEPGEEVEFSIRFDNIGGKIIERVTIIDNLTTRLEYVPDSAECSVPAKFTPDPNDGDSLTLKWEIIEPLKVGQGGVIRFRCRVR